MNINFSTATQGKLRAHHIVPRLELITCLWLKKWANFPQATQEDFSLSNRDLRRTLCFLSQVEWTSRDPDSKEGQISLQWLKFRLVFHLTRWRHVWIPWGDPSESRRGLPYLDGGLTSLWPFESTRNSMLHKVTVPDSSSKWIGIPISLCQLESEPWSPASPSEASVLFWKA